MTSEKARFRAKYRAVRMAMNRNEVQEKSQLIGEKLLLETDWSKIKSVYIYQAMDRLNEVDTKPLLAKLENEYPEIKITLAGQNRDIRLPRQKFDLIVVPVLAFDKDNYRLGWGGGWYDRFLANQPQALKIGLAYQNSFVPGGLPREPHDIPLDKVITEL
ncbi:MAG TPA: 5-formyltetrahydrofolate cyclo-ligase [Candidatus Saccharimonadales bacterium]|nr:5-formyltetrahydrofolate cyclo-ligase [Candidatus Saccharimonadales bacterium]